MTLLVARRSSCYLAEHSVAAGAGADTARDVGLAYRPVMYVSRSGRSELRVVYAVYCTRALDFYSQRVRRATWRLARGPTEARGRDVYGGRGSHGGAVRVCRGGKAPRPFLFSRFLRSPPSSRLPLALAAGGGCSRADPPVLEAAIGGGE